MVINDLTDYPAAHSMDSSWFAVDRDGRVAYFDTGEAGAMPTNALQGDQAYELSEALIEVLPACNVIFDPTGHIMPVLTEAQPPQIWPAMSQIVFVRDLGPFRELISSGAHVVSATEGYAMIIQHVTPEIAALVNSSGQLTTCGWYYGDDATLATRGIYCYSHLAENWAAGPYGRHRVPSQPIHIDQLPPRLRRPLKVFSLEHVRFGEDHYVQPIEWVECTAWGDDWVDCRGASHVGLPSTPPGLKE